MSSHVITCPCGTETAARPGRGEVSTLEGRKRQLRPTEAGLVGPGLTTFIAALSVRYRLSRAKIAELLSTWFDVRLSVGSIDRAIREAGLACEPIVEGLLADLRAAGVVDADETPWPQRGKLRWLWVALSSTTAIYRIASRHAVIARRISHGTRTDEGSRAYAAILSLVETCRRRKADPWAVMERAIANARTGLESTTIPA